jgi:hypothetical protein
MSHYLFEQQQALDTGYTALKSYIANIGVVVVAIGAIITANKQQAHFYPR